VHQIVFTLSWSLSDQYHGEESSKHDIKLVVVGKYSAPGFQSSEQSLNAIAPFVQFFVMLPRLPVLRVGWCERCQTLCLCQNARSIVLIGATIQQQGDLPMMLIRLPAFERIARLPPSGWIKRFRRY